MPSAGNYNMRGLLIFVLLISAIYADDPVHYPTNHPGVCNILAFVSEHVDEVVHVAHDEVEGHVHNATSTIESRALNHTNNSNDNSHEQHNTTTEKSSALLEDVKKVKRQVEEIMQKAQCLLTDFKKEEITENPQDSAVVLTEVPLKEEEFQSTTLTAQTDEELKDIQRSARDVNYLIENYETHYEIDEEKPIAAKRHVRDVSHLLSSIPLQQSASLENEVKAQNNLPYNKADYTEFSDGLLIEETENVEKLYGEQLFPPTIGQHVDFQGREKRALDIKKLTISSAQQHVKRLARNVKEIFKTQSSQQNSISQFIQNLHNSQDLSKNNQSPTRIVRSSLMKNIEKPKEIPNQPKYFNDDVLNNKRVVRAFAEDLSSQQSSSVLSGTSTLKPFELQQPKEGEPVKATPLAKQHTNLPLTQFARRKSSS